MNVWVTFPPTIKSVSAISSYEKNSHPSSGRAFAYTVKHPTGFCEVALKPPRSECRLKKKKSQRGTAGFYFDV